MHALYDLKDKLCAELEDYGKKGELTAGTLEIIDKLAHATKNVDKIIEKYEEEEYSNAGGSYYDGGSYRDSYRDGGSYRGGRTRRGGYSRGRNRDGRYSSDGYSRTGEIAERLRNIMNDAPDDRSRLEIQNLLARMEM